MLPRQHRIKSGSDFKFIMRSGRRVSSPAMTIYAHPNNLGLIRFGFVVSKSVGNAVMRNQVKRRLRAAANEHLASNRSVDIVVRANPSVIHERVAALSLGLERALFDSSNK